MATHRFTLCVLAAMSCLPLASGSLEGRRVRLGMTPEEVVQILGTPDRRAILDGKLLRDLSELDSATDLSKHRLVFFYDDIYLQVWFKDGHVTGVIQNGVSIVSARPFSRGPSGSYSHLVLIESVKNSHSNPKEDPAPGYGRVEGVARSRHAPR